jgi:SAM-dependent methyltransferase
MNGFTKRSPAKLSRKATPNARICESWTPEKLRSLSCYWHARIVGTAFHLQLFAWLGTTAKTAGAVSRHFGGKTPEWEIFLNALSAMKLLRRRGNRYDNSRFAARYLGGRQASFLLADYDAWNLWGRLPEILTSGNRPKVAQPFFTDRDKAERLLRALDDDGQKIAPYVIRRLPLSRAKSVLDVGGGLGTLALACCRRFPGLRATILEHPNVAPLTRSNVEKSRMKNRVEVIAIDVFKDIWPRGGFDAVLASNVLHGQGARENRALIASAYDCLNTGGHLIVRDVLGGTDAADPAWGALFSVALLVQTPKGRCYSLDEVRGWLEQAGFSNLQGPFGSSPLFFDPDSLLIAEKN